VTPLAADAALAQPAVERPSSRPVRVDLLNDLGLTLETVLSDDDSFLTLLCRDDADRRVVLKYVHSGSADAHRRLRNEAALVKHLRGRPPLRFLEHRRDGPGFLVTGFDSGVLLYPDAFEPEVAATVGTALAVFQSLAPPLGEIGVVDREHVATYYLKVLVKNLLHLWPAYLTTSEAARCVAIVTAALPAICRRSVVCHGDFLPTNLLYHREDRSVTITDLEGFMSSNHPLFDVLAFFSISSVDLMDWSWQRAFLAEYLPAAAAFSGIDSESEEYGEAYRGLLVFYLVYRLNEERIALTAGSYFDGLGKRRFVARKAARLALGHRDAWQDDGGIRAALQVRQSNLRRALSETQYLEHFRSLHAAFHP